MEGTKPQAYQELPGTAYSYSDGIRSRLQELSDRVQQLRAAGKLSPTALRQINKFFRIKSIHHSNAIEGNQLNLGETRMVIEQGLTISGKPLKDSAEARNLGHALDFFEELATSSEGFRCHDVRQIHALILRGIDDENAGAYRKINVEISGSAFSPPPTESVPMEMDDFCKWLFESSAPDTPYLDQDPVILAAAAHAWFVRIHPFADGNGRTARLIMNLMLMRFGHPIAVITKDERQRYYDALEESQSSDLTPFIALIVESVAESLEEYERAVAEQTAQVEWAQSLVAKFTGPQQTEAENYYEVWKASMDLFKGYARQLATVINESARGLARIYVEDYGTLEFEKYLSLRGGQATKRTWFFRVDFRTPDRAARYLFFFGFPSSAIRPNLNLGDRVTLHLSTEESPFLYERLDNLMRDDLPDLREIAYNAGDEQYIARFKGGLIQPIRAEKVVQDFFNQVVQRNFPA